MTQTLRISDNAFRALQLKAVGLEGARNALDRILMIDDDTARKYGPHTIDDLIKISIEAPNKPMRDAALREIHHRYIAWGWAKPRGKRAKKSTRAVKGKSTRGPRLVKSTDESS